MTSRFVTGQQVYVDGEFATVTAIYRGGALVMFSDGTELNYVDTMIRTVAEALTHARYILTRTANHLGDVPLMDALEHAAPYIERAMQQCDAADAVKGLT